MQMPPKPYPYTKNGVLIVGKAMYSCMYGDNKVSGEFLLTRDLLTKLLSLHEESDQLDLL